ncbi:MAG: biotin--[acetyl-CoA-carboxylase] ligase [Corynebacteriales bacterium]|nr:biotin--[acetyl-CoA-carboxylase] ligase [Mycobacteriales bacterium]
MSSPFANLDRPPLSAKTLRRTLITPGGFWRDIRVLSSTGSTNADAAAAAREGAAEGLVVVADEQTAGRGRLARTWVSPPRAGLAISVLLRPAGLPLSWFPLLTGVAVTRAITQLTGVKAALKWPNDVLIGSGSGQLRKAGGILAERVEPDAVVMGVGLNVTTTPEELPNAGATSLLLANASTNDRNVILRAILRALADDYTTWRAHGGDAERSGLREAYRELCATLGQVVRVELPASEPLIGQAADIDTNGHLLVATGSGVTTISAGDVVHVRPHN